MKLPSKKRISMLLVSLLVATTCFGLRFWDGDKNKTFPCCQIEKINNFPECSNDIYRIVAGKMGLVINKNVPKPIILTDKQITLQKFNSYLGWDANEVLPYYFHNKNTVVIPCYCKLDSLAHEFVHYFQAMYQNEDFDCTDGMIAEDRESEAIVIQRWFRTKFIGSRLPQ